MQIAGEIFIAATGAIVGAVASHFAQNSAQNKQDEKINLLSRLGKLEMQVNDIENVTIQLQGRVQSLEGAVVRIETSGVETRKEMKELSKELKQELKSAVAEIKADIKAEIKEIKK
jgi:chromosome segregation ATPase